MTTTNPRINVTLKPHRFALYRRLAALQGVSMSALVADLLETVAEPMERVCVVLEAASKAPESVRNGLRVAVARAEAGIMPHLAESMGQMDIFLQATEAAVKAPGGVGEAGAPGGARQKKAAAAANRPDPRLVTRGSIPLPETKKAAVKPATKPSRRAPARRKTV